MNKLPKISLFVYTYNHASFIAEAVDAALAQTYFNLEIILSDDNSTDGTYEIMQAKAAEYKGSHKIILNRNEKNLGISDHLNKIMTLGSGDWFVLAAGDDISFPKRVETIMSHVSNNPEVMAFYSGFEIINQNGEIQNYHGFDTNRLYVTGATGAWNRKLFDVFGPITQSTTAEDVVIPFRAMLLGKLMLLNDATVYYREHQQSISNPLNNNHLAAQKHLYKICHQLVNACQQRLLDIEKVKDNIAPTLYNSLITKHDNILLLLQNRIESIGITIQMLESPVLNKIKYLFWHSAAIKHESFILRTKQLLLSLDLFNNFNKLRSKHKSTSDYLKTGDVFTMDLKQLNEQEKDLLIYL
jgi:glycosyltransferase involved in cell wall biosynthesis